MSILQFNELSNSIHHKSEDVNSRKMGKIAYKHFNFCGTIIDMTEEIPITPENTFEQEERIPTFEEVKLVLESVLEGKVYKEERKLEDEKGVYLWEVSVEDSEGKAEYNYTRKGRHATNIQASYSGIDVTLYDTDGMPCGGSSMAKFINNKWELTP